MAALQQLVKPPQPGQFVYSETKGPSGGISRIWLSADGQRPGLTANGDVIHVIPSGSTRFIGYLPDLPTDPSQVLSYLTQAGLIRGDVASTNHTGKSLHFLLEHVYLLPTQRAALYEFLAATPGFTYVPSAVDAIGRGGVGISWSTPSGGGSNQIIFDPTTHSYLGIRTWPSASYTGPTSPYYGEALITMAVVGRAGEIPGSPRSTWVSAPALSWRDERPITDFVKDHFTVRLFREPRALDRFRDWQITVDGKTERSIAPRETAVLVLEASSFHALRVGGKWQTSHERQVQGRPGDVFELVCRPRRPTLLKWMPFGVGPNIKHDLYFVDWPGTQPRPKPRIES